MKALTNRLLSRLAVRGQHTVLHAGVITLVATAIFMMYTAGEMGPMGPLIIALSFYVVFAAVMIEVILGAFALSRKLAQAGLRRFS
ncbi:hypothetical protein [Paraburkholderia dioscoreae]|uniref:Uncharacterized protein n=1 Tax=Paraburkholderia dioscoreae TaxID=2604047 RepID=A0A5Q4ZHR7_9BURK|nr:hypothetical protein [Paraburkholderia dioscoreae]VVD30927.1 conserved protein of unknown function [Paraburkholderia dioscoreae]